MKNITYAETNTEIEKDLETGKETKIVERKTQRVKIEQEPDFVKLAEAMGAVGFRAEKPKEVREILEEAMKIDDRPVILDFVVDREENVLPMVPPGKSYKDMILEDGKGTEAETMYLVG